MNQSRRAVLAACCAGLTTLGGCSSLDIGDDTPSYDTARLAALGQEELPRPPATFPVSVPDAMVSRHRDRARELVERVPKQPDIPNGAIVERLRQERKAVLERLGEDGDDANGFTSDPLEQLEDARYDLGEAAAVEATYRAATNAITPEAVADRRAQLRSDLFAFERDWTYRGDDPTSAVVVHRALEELRREVRRGITPDRAFPDDPGTDVFGAGEIVSCIEAGRAALTDAGRLRTRYRDSPSDQRPYRTAISVAAGRLRRIGRLYSRDLDEYVIPDSEALPFDRSIEDTPLERLYREAVESVRRRRRAAEEARHRGDQATVVIETGISIAGIRALDAIVADIRNDRVTVPGTVDGIAAARREAIDVLERAWSAAPTVLAAELAHLPYALVDAARDLLRGSGYREDYTPSTKQAHAAFTYYVLAARYAAAVPQTVADVQAALRAATE